ncbi:serine aminopeptidase domain-containing protein [Burkholderia singularis]|nr:alpha/beta hydrolase [Burkholderia singularis]
MKPVRFDHCLGWLHEGRTQRGVVLCEALGHEAMWTHKVIRALAERLAADGMWVLRFHYPSAGDSAGDDLASGRLQASVASVQRAVAVLREHAPVDEVTLVGVRAGAAFAMLALTGDDAPAVDTFVALAPVVRGRAYLRELSMVQKRWLDTTPPAIREQHHEEPWLNILGHRYPADLVAALRTVDLGDAVARISAPPRAALLVDTDYGDSAALGDALTARGVPTDIEPFPDWPTVLQEGVRSRLPHTVLDSVARWIGRNGGRAAQEIGQPVARRAEHTFDTDAPVRFAFNGITETLVRVGEKQLVGTLCEPATPARASAPCVLISNTSANPRSADGRIGVRLARALAQQGITSLRIDVEGIGDSGAHAPDDQSKVVFSDQAVSDVTMSADWLAARCGRQVVAFGVCSGAYLSIHAAAHAQSVSGVIAINLPRFIWPRGLTVLEARKQQTNSTRGYLASLRDWSKWRRLLREGRDLRPVLNALQRHLTARVKAPAAQIAERLGWQPKRGTPRALMNTLAERNVRSMLVYGEFDPGVDELTRSFGSLRSAFKGSPLVQVETIRLLDHSVYGTYAADTVISICVDTLIGWGGKTPGPRLHARRSGKLQNETPQRAADAAAAS